MATLTDRSRAVDDGGDGGQRPGVTFQALVGSLVVRGQRREMLSQRNAGEVTSE